ncbi:MAG: TRAP transporter small permease subunit, partial [Pararhodobacter sp.]|nr:TRAP transporter small permease subunit [Pararhodobacter sp.]
MNGLSVLMRTINALNRLIGVVFSWLALAIVIVCFWVVIERYFFGNTRLWMQDLYPWLNGVMFTAVAAYALYHNDHVRVDIFYRPASNVKKAWMDLIGVVIFLLPTMLFVWIYSYSFVARSWGLKEASSNPGGAQGLYIVKVFILVFAATVALQGLSMLLRSILIIRRREDLVP